MLGTLAFLVPLVNLFCLVKVRGEYWAKSENVEFLTIEVIAQIIKENSIVG